MKTKAFTLIELLVVIAVIAILMAVLLPALSLAKKKGATTACMSNTKNLSLGWYMYSGDNDGGIMSADDGGTERSGKWIGWCGIPRNAAGALMGNTQADPAVTDDDEIRGIQVGLLYPYVKTPKAYHCPADNVRVSIYDRTKVFVTYSIAMCLNGYPSEGSSGYGTQIHRYGQITSPSRRYVFVEAAEPRNWNSGHHFVIGSPEVTGTTEWAWWGPIAINHGDSSVLGFCDGHAETRKWRDKFTIEWIDKIVREGVANYGTQAPPPDQTLDMQYMADGWAYRYKGARQKQG